MKDSIITRKIDELGRIAIPIEIRKELKITEGQKLSIFIKDKNIVLGIDTEQKNGILATVDELGRILIFRGIREKVELEPEQKLNIYADNNEIILQKQVG